jgi:uncharacterized protein YggT (Ycf19 family)
VSLPLLIFVQAIRLYMLLIFLWALASWFPQWRYSRWYRILEDLVAPYVNLFRGLNLHMGQMDFTALVAMMVLMAFETLVTYVARGGLN